MKVEVVPVGSSQREIQISIPAADVRGELDKAFRELGRRVRLPGFRAGRAPRTVLEQRFGGQVRADVAQNLVDGSWRKLVEGDQLDPVGRPAVNAPQLPGAEDFEFTITVAVRPEIELEQYTGVEAVYPKVEVPEEEVQAEIDRKLEGEQRLVAVEDRPVEEGDFVLAEFSLSAPDEEEPVAQEMGAMIRTAGDPYYPGIEPLLIGRSVEEEVEGEVRIEESAKADEVAGRELQARIKVHSIQINEIPELTDELAEKLGYAGGVDGMRESIRAQRHEARDEAARNQARANVLQALIDRNPFEVPEEMIEEQLEALKDELRYQEAYRGRDPKKVAFSAEQIVVLRNRASFATKGGLILDYVIKAESIEITDEDLEQKFQEMADERGQTVEAIRGYFVKDGGTDMLRERMLEERALDWLLEHAKLVEPEPAPDAAEEDAVEEEPAAAESDEAEPVEDEVAEE